MSMLKEPGQKYRPFPQIDLPDRQWPSRVITNPPRWLSTDLRDGNQSIIDPMDAVKKNRFFDLLIETGFKEIEVGFPSAGQTEFDFISSLVRNGRIPDDVFVQVLTQSREDLIRTSFDSLEGAHAAIIHLYNAVSPAWRDIVFQMTQAEVKAIAIKGAQLLRRGVDWQYEVQDNGWRFSDAQGALDNLPLPQVPQPNAATALAALRASGLAVSEQAIRDGIEQSIFSVDLVPSDVILLCEGVKIPADGIVLRCNDLCVDENSLTGEAEGVWKCQIDDCPPSADYWRKDYSQSHRQQKPSLRWLLLCRLPDWTF